MICFCHISHLCFLSLSKYIVCPYFYVVLELLKWECQIRNFWLNKIFLKQGEKNYFISMRSYFIKKKKKSSPPHPPHKSQACFLLSYFWLDISKTLPADWRTEEWPRSVLIPGHVAGCMSDQMFPELSTGHAVLGSNLSPLCPEVSSQSRTYLR